MIFKLPNYSDLTNQQREVVNYNPESNLVIQGYPGTGKSVLAIFKAKNFVEQEKKVLLLVFNRPLKEYMYTGVKEASISLEIDTWHNWLKNFYLLNFGCVPPQYTKFKYKWNEIHQQFHDLHEKYSNVYDQIVIDEGQDLPKELYECLFLLTNNITCMIDPDQKLFSTSARMNDILHILHVMAPLTLQENFRNPKEIMEFATLYKDNNAKSVHESGEKPHLMHVNNSDEQLQKIYALIKRNYMLNSIGILTTTDYGGTVYNYLKEKNDDEYDLYAHFGETKKLEFKNTDNLSVFVLSINCMKGLEFDSVIVPNFDTVFSTAFEMEKNKIYCAITRTSGSFYGFYKNDFTNVFHPIKDHKDLINWG